MAAPCHVKMRRISKTFFQPLPDNAAFAEQNQQVIAHHRGRQNHGQREHGIEQFAAGKAFAGQQKPIVMPRMMLMPVAVKATLSDK